MTENAIEFSKIQLINDNYKNNNFQVQFERLKFKLNKVQLMAKDVIDKKQFNFKEVFRKSMNLQLFNSSKELNNKEDDFINNSEKNKNTLTISNNKENEIFNDLETNNEKEINSYIISNKNLNNYLMPSIQENSLSINENINSNNSEKYLSNNNSISSFNNNLFIVETKENKKSKKRLLGNKQSNKERNKNNKKIDLENQINELYNRIKEKADKFKFLFQIKDKNKDIKTIIMEDKTILDIYFFKDKIKKIYTYEQNLISKKNKDIIAQLNTIENIFEKKLLILGLNINYNI